MSIASRTQSRRSVETWSLRLRAVWSLRPTSPSAVGKGLLDVHVDVFQFRAEREAVLLNFLAYLAQGLLNLPSIRQR